MKLMDLVKDLSEKLNRKPTTQEIQDEIFRTMPADKKIKLASDLTVFARELNNLKNGNNRPAKSSDQSGFSSR